MSLNRFAAGLATAAAGLLLAASGCFPDFDAVRACTDGVRGEDESDVDCGGPSGCGRCAAERRCATGSDCASGACADDRCAAADSCTNESLDGGESDVDCGGSSACRRCATREACREASDCASGGCEDERCVVLPSCANGARDAGESDVDCGGDNACDRCALGQRCLATADCDEGVCQSNRCREVDPCLNRVLDGTETDIDCGGGCSPCPLDASCVIGADCETRRCVAGACAPIPPTCSDGAVNGDETDMDCGGSCVPDRRCGVGRRCETARDCTTFSCVNDACVADEPIAEGDLIDDMEDGDVVAPSFATRGGSAWYVVHDQTTGAELSGGAPVPSAIADGRSASDFGIHFAGGGFTNWGAALMLDLKTWTGGAPSVYDASRYAGITFWARAENDGQIAIVAFLSRDTDQNFPVCDPGPPSGGPTPGCNDYHHVRVELDTEWTRYAVSFEDAAQAGFGLPLAGALKPTELYGIRFAVDPNQPFDFWIDDVAFSRE